MSDEDAELSARRARMGREVLAALRPLGITSPAQFRLWFDDLQKRLGENPAGNPDETQWVFPEDLTPEWCVSAFHRVNPGAQGNPTVRVPSLYLLDFAREVLREFRQGKKRTPCPRDSRQSTGGD